VTWQRNSIFEQTKGEIWVWETEKRTKKQLKTTKAPENRSFMM